jgi:hypothetical protein
VPEITFYYPAEDVPRHEPLDLEGLPVVIHNEDGSTTRIGTVGKTVEDDPNTFFAQLNFPIMQTLDVSVVDER